MPAAEHTQKLLIGLWLKALEPFEDAEVEAVAMPILTDGRFALKPGDVVAPLQAKRLGLPSWDVAYAEVRDAILAQCGKLRDMPDSPAKRVGMIMRNAILNVGADNAGTIQAQFRDAYENACATWKDEQRQPGGLLAIDGPSKLRLVGGTS